MYGSAFLRSQGLTLPFNQKSQDVIKITQYHLNKSLAVERPASSYEVDVGTYNKPFSKLFWKACQKALCFLLKDYPRAHHEWTLCLGLRKIYGNLDFRYTWRCIFNHLRVDHSGLLCLAWVDLELTVLAPSATVVTMGHPLKVESMVLRPGKNTSNYRLLHSICRSTRTRMSYVDVGTYVLCSDQEYIILINSKLTCSK